jgi:hypothetical protein
MSATDTTRSQIGPADANSIYGAKAKKGIDNKAKTPKKYWQVPRYQSGTTDTGDEPQLAIVDPHEAIIPAELNPDNPDKLIPDAQKPAQDSGLGSAMPQDKAASPLGSAMGPQPLASMKPYGASVDAQPAADTATHQAKIDQAATEAAAKGDLIALGKASLAHRALDQTYAGLGSALATPELPTYGGPGSAVPQGDLIPAKQLPADELKYKRAQLKQQMLSPDLIVSGNAERQLAELDKQNPWGSPGNHPGPLGRITHGLAKAANIAGDVVAPGTMSLIPGTDLNRARQVESGLGKIKLGSETDLQGAQAKNQLAEAQARQAALANPKKDYEVKEVRDTRKGSPTEGQSIWAGVNKADPTDIKYSPGQVAPPAAAPKEADVPLGDKVSTINEQLLERYQVLNPKAATLPAKWTVPDNATTADYNRIDKAMEAVEKAQANATQLAAVDALKKQTAAAQQESRDQLKATQGRKMVIGTNPKTGREEMVPASEADKLTDVYDAPADSVNKVISARHFIPLADNKDPNNPGILQMIDTLQKEDKLGEVTSRWEDFLAGKVGEGDPDFERLRVAMGLATTLLVNAHVGSRGGSYMMEHFQSLADAGKMNARTLRAGVDQELKYIKNRAMEPASTSTSGNTVPIGARPILKDGKQVGYIDGSGKRVNF